MKKGHKLPEQDGVRTDYSYADLGGLQERRRATCVKSELEVKTFENVGCFLRMRKENKICFSKCNSVKVKN